jgi:cytochrome c biogenesis protein CcmG/thiol:disulfide interchange protein DsbE
LETEHAKHGFAVIGISVDEQGWRTVKPFLTKLGVRYRVLLGDRRMSSAYAGADIVPTTLLLDRSGRIAAIHAGVVSRSKFEDMLGRLLRTDSGTLAERVPRGH